MMSSANEKKRKMNEDSKNADNRDPVDKAYFSCYSDITVHEKMLADKVRTNAYRMAILKNYEDIRGKVVADIGAGTGILSMFCVQAGAKKVYAIEASDMADQIELVAKKNKMQDRITVVHGKVEEVELPEKVDIIVSEWMGFSLVYESMLLSVIVARDRWLKKDGILFPSTATLYMAPFSGTERETYKGCFWEDASSWYKVDLTALKPYAEKCKANWVRIITILPHEVQAHASAICHFDVKSVTAEYLSHIEHQFSFKCFGRNPVHGMVCWFDVAFPRDVSLSTSPYHEPTHWFQSVLEFNSSIDAEQDTTISGTIKLTPNKQNRRFLDISLKHAVNDGTESTQTYVMDDMM